MKRLPLAGYIAALFSSLFALFSPANLIAGAGAVATFAVSVVALGSPAMALMVLAVLFSLAGAASMPERSAVRSFRERLAARGRWRGSFAL